MKKALAVFILFFSITTATKAQNKEYKPVDEYVKSLGALDTLNMGTISYLVTKKFPDLKDKVRAIFDWVTLNISLDPKATGNNDNTKTFSDEVLKSRKATSAGYAALFQDMCSVVKIRCLTVDGYVNKNVEDIGVKPDEKNHTWAVVQLGQSPESWFYVDPSMGSGYLDDKMTKFTRAYNDAYFFADNRIFNYQHYADNTAWQLGAGPKGLKDFASLPLVKDGAYEFKINNFTPSNGKIKAKTTKSVQFSFNVGPDAKIEIVALAIGEKNKKTKTVDYTITKGMVNFSYKFEDADTYPVEVLVNNKPVLVYYAEIDE